MLIYSDDHACWRLKMSSTTSIPSGCRRGRSPNGRPSNGTRDRPSRQAAQRASPPTSTALGSQVRSGSSWPLSGNCTEKQLPTDTPRPTASFGPCHRPPVPRRACVEPTQLASLVAAGIAANRACVLCRWLLVGALWARGKSLAFALLPLDRAGLFSNYTSNPPR